MRQFIVLVVAATLVGGCATTTRIGTKPAGAKVIIDGALVGTTPTVFHDSRGLPKRYHVEIYREGSQPIDMYVDSQMDWTFGLLGLFLSPLFYLWAWNLDDDMTVSLRPAEGGNPMVPVSP
ncbi:MAG: PEGA domain-containing protein [Pseudomonadota bacterium]